MTTSPDLWLLFGIGLALVVLARAPRPRRRPRSPGATGPAATLPDAP